MAIAQACLKNLEIILPRYIVTGLVLLLIFSSFLQPLGAVSFLLVALITGAGIVRLLAKEKQHSRQPGLFSMHLRQVGLWSYSIYLLHQPILNVMPRLAAKLSQGGEIPPWLMFSLCVSSWLVIVPVASLFYRRCELPSNALGRYLLELFVKKKPLLA